MGASQNLRGAGFMVLSMAGFSLNDALIKTVAGELPLFQAIFLRGALVALVVGAIALGRGAFASRPGRRDLRLIAMRCAGEIGGTLCFLTALFHMPLASASAILQSVPLAMTLAAAVFLGEPVGWRRYAAIVVGFAGVLIIVRPGTQAFNASALWAVAAIGFIVLRDLSTRRLSGAVSALGLVFVSGTALTLVAGGLALATEWRPVAWGELARLGGSGGFLLVGWLAGVSAMRIGEIGFVQPFRYTLLVWAMLLGIVIFGEWPDAWMLAGSAVVVATGLFTFYRERRLGLAASSGGRGAAAAR